jgi:hypothetical protein
MPESIKNQYQFYTKADLTKLNKELELYDRLEKYSGTQKIQDIIDRG